MSDSQELLVVVQQLQQPLVLRPCSGEKSLRRRRLTLTQMTRALQIIERRGELCSRASNNRSRLQVLLLTSFGTSILSECR